MTSVTTSAGVSRSLVLWILLSALLGTMPALLTGQETSSRLVATNMPLHALDLPDAPGRQTSTTSSEIQQGTGSISGVVLDINDGIVANATVKLVEDDRPGERTEKSDAEGRFTFSALPAGKFRVTISAPSLSSFVSNEILLHAGEHHEMAQIGLPPTTSLDAQVTVTQVEIAQEQIELQEKQRIFGVLPNFYTSYIWDAAPLSAKQKFGLAAKSITDPVIFAATFVAAGIEQARNTFPAYGDGVQGYAKRYASDYGDEVSSRMFASAIFPSIFHQDPRYFYAGTGSKSKRALYAVTRSFVTRGDSGHIQPNYSRILGALVAGALSNAYHQGDDRGVHLFLRNSLIAIGGNSANNVLREFLPREATTNVPDYAKGKPEETAPAAKK